MDLAEINIVSSDSPSEIITPDAAFQASGLSPLQIKVCCNTDGDRTKEHVKSAAARNLAVVQALEPNARHAVIVGGGPSLKWNWTEIFYWISEGADIFALNGTAKFFNDRCILPTFQVMVDPREANVSMLGKAKEYLIASQCHPAVFDAVNPDNTGLFHMVGSAQGLVDGTLIGGDITVGLVAPCLAYTLGYRSMHLYGYDSSYADGDHHAYNQDQTDQEQMTLEVFAQVDGRMVPFTTNYAMAKQAELFPRTAELLCNHGAVITVHGTGLLPTIANSLRKPEAQAAE
jgi:hypothetical protein